MEVPAGARALLEELARGLGIAGLAFDDMGTVTLELDEGALVCLAVESSGEALILFAPVSSGQLADHGLARRALEANFLWRGTGEATLAVEPVSGQLVLHRRLQLTGLDYPTFAALLEGFAERAGLWAEEASKAAGSTGLEAEVPDGPRPPLFDPSMFA